MTMTERVRVLFLSRPGEWVDGRELAQVGGYAAWRSRVVDCRQQFGMAIENKTERRPHLTVSAYRYTPAELMEIARSPDPRD